MHLRQADGFRLPPILVSQSADNGNFRHITRLELRGRGQVHDHRFCIHIRIKVRNSIMEESKTTIGIDIVADKEKWDGCRI